MTKFATFDSRELFEVAVHRRCTEMRKTKKVRGSNAWSGFGHFAFSVCVCEMYKRVGSSCQRHRGRVNICWLSVFIRWKCNFHFQEKMRTTRIDAPSTPFVEVSQNERKVCSPTPRQLLMNSRFMFSLNSFSGRTRVHADTHYCGDVCKQYTCALDARHIPAQMWY